MSPVCGRPEFITIIVIPLSPPGVAFIFIPSQRPVHRGPGVWASGDLKYGECT